jgi:hypothetical protein
MTNDQNDDKSKIKDESKIDVDSEIEDNSKNTNIFENKFALKLLKAILFKLGSKIDDDSENKIDDDSENEIDDDSQNKIDDDSENMNTLKNNVISELLNSFGSKPESENDDNSKFSRTRTNKILLELLNTFGSKPESENDDNSKIINAIRSKLASEIEDNSENDDDSEIMNAIRSKLTSEKDDDSENDDDSEIINAILSELTSEIEDNSEKEDNSEVKDDSDIINAIGFKVLSRIKFAVGIKDPNYKLFDNLSRHCHPLMPALVGLFHPTFPDTFEKSIVFEKSKHYLEKSTKNDSPLSLFYLGDAYLSGIFGDSYEIKFKGLRLLLRAAYLNNSAAMTKLGNLFDTGIFVGKNLRLAADYFINQSRISESDLSDMRLCQLFVDGNIKVRINFLSAKKLINKCLDPDTEECKDFFLSLDRKLDFS